MAERGGGLPVPEPGASSRQRADLARWRGGLADHRAQVHHRQLVIPRPPRRKPCRGRFSELRPVRRSRGRFAQQGARHDPGDVRVEGGRAAAPGEAGDRGGRVRPHPRQRRKLRLVEGDAPEPCERLSRRPLQVHGSAVVAQPRPLPDDRRRRRLRKARRRGPALQPRLVARTDALDLRLLQHYLRDQYGVRVPGQPPGEVVPSVRAIPASERPPQPRKLAARGVCASRRPPRSPRHRHQHRHRYRHRRLAPARSRSRPRCACGGSVAAPPRSAR